MSAETGVRAVVEVMARALTDRPDAVRVTESQHKHMTVIELSVAPCRTVGMSPTATWEGL